jgi:hypothetical protein
MFLRHYETEALTFFVAFREGGVSSSPLNMRDRGGATNLLLTGRDGASDIRSVRDCACVKNENHYLNDMFIGISMKKKPG